MHERYCLMRQNVGYPPIILHIVAYPVAALPSAQDLEARVNELQTALPMLHPRLADPHTNHPSYAQGDAYPASDIVHETTFTPVADKDAESIEVYRTAMNSFNSLDPTSNPLWRVTLARPADDGDRAYLTLALNHLIADGRGSTLLLRVLTEDLGRPSAVAQEDWATPTRFDDTISISPRVGFLLPIVFRELLLPKFPKFVQRPFLSGDPWPGQQVNGTPLEAEWDILLFSIPAERVGALKAAGKANGVRTLHPLLKMAYTAALWRVFGAGQPLHLAASTARDERDQALGHAPITHNYVSLIDWDVTLAPTDKFWARAREVAKKITSQAGIDEGRMTLGLLKHIPDPDVDASAPDFDPTRPTGWEKYFVERASSSTPFRESVSLSNLGLIKLPPGAIEAWWGQTATFGAAIMVNVIGHEGGVRISSAFRIVATDKERTAKLHAVMQQILDRIAAGSVAADDTVDAVTA